MGEPGQHHEASPRPATPGPPDARPARPTPPHGPADPAEALAPGAGRGRWSRRPADDAEARALASGLRLRILRLTLDEALTNQEIAERLDRNPASVLHHVRTLVATGFLVPLPERRGPRGAREVPYLATRTSWYLSTPADRGMLDAFVGEASRVPPGELDLARLGLRLSAQGVERLRSRLRELLEELAEAEPEPDGQPWSLFVALHPDPGRR